MRINFLVSSMAGGGAERVASMLCNWWAAAGHDVCLIPTFSKRGAVAYPLSDRVEVHFLSDHVGTNASRISRLLGLRAQIREWQPDAIIAFLPHVNVAAILAALGTGIPVLVCERTYPPAIALPLLHRLQRRMTYPFANAIVAQTEMTADWLRQRVFGAPVHVIPNPVNHPVLASEPRIAPGGLVGADRRLILWAGRFDQFKRPEIMVEAFARIADAHRDWDLAMIGDGETRNGVEDMVNAHGLSHRVLIPGFAGNLGDWYARADLYVMTSAFEGFPNTLLEAMAYGLASTAFDVATGPAELSAGCTRVNLLPDNNHVDRLTAALSELITNSAKRKALAAEAIKARTDYASDKVYRQWDALLAQHVPLCAPSEPKF